MCGSHSHAPLVGTWPTTQACALTGNRTSDPLVCRLALNPLSYTSQGCPNTFKKEKKKIRQAMVKKNREKMNS